MAYVYVVYVAMSPVTMSGWKFGIQVIVIVDNLNWRLPKLNTDSTEDNTSKRLFKEIESFYKYPVL